MGAIIRDERYRWPNGIIPFMIDKDLPDPQRVYDAIKEWETKTIIRFIKRRNFSEPDFFDQNYVTFTDQLDPDENCESPLGMRGNKQTIELTENCRAGQVMHEIGHTVGLSHEHQRSDRARYVDYYEENVQERKKDNFIIASTDTIQNVGYYDYGSIMHYSSTAFALLDGAGNLKQTLVPKDSSNPLIPYDSIGQRKGLSRGDINTVYFAYVCPEAYQPPRLQVGDRAFLKHDTTPNKVRTKPGLASDVKEQSIQPGQQMMVVKGPVSVQGEKYLWWYVRLLAKDVEGWTAEAGEDGYWLVPQFTT